MSPPKHPEETIPHQLGSAIDDKERLWSEYAKLEASMKCWKVLVVPRLSWSKNGGCGFFGDQVIGCGACKQLVDEVGGSWRCVVAWLKVFQLKAFKSSNTEVSDSRMLAVLKTRCP
ncbi:hypothetical protein Tco_1554866 [Tanacetum coccineum]